MQSIGGWASLEASFWAICYPSSPSDGPSESPEQGRAANPSRMPSLACNNEPTLINLFDQFPHDIATSEDPFSVETRVPDFPATLPISPNLVLTHPGLLPIILNLTRLPYTMTAPTTYPSPSRIPPHPAALTPAQEKLESLTYRILIVIIQSSWSNLFKTQKFLPSIYEAILRRLYGPSVGRREESEMAKSLELEPSRRKAAEKEKREQGELPRFLVTSYADLASPGGTVHGPNAIMPASNTTVKQANYVHELAGAALRPILLKLLRRLVEAGIPVEYAHMLFRLAKKSNAPTALAIIKNAQAAEDGAEGPTTEGGVASNRSSPSKSPAGRRTRPAKPMSLKLALNVLAGSAKNGPSVLDKDILEILRHGIDGGRMCSCFRLRWAGRPVDCIAGISARRGRRASRGIISWPGFTSSICAGRLRCCIYTRTSGLCSGSGYYQIRRWGLSRPGRRTSRIRWRRLSFRPRIPWCRIKSGYMSQLPDVGLVRLKRARQKSSYSSMGVGRKL
jgi:hypothetical protein